MPTETTVDRPGATIGGTSPLTQESPAMLSPFGSLTVTSAAQPALSGISTDANQTPPVLKAGAVAAYNANANGVGLWAQATTAGQFEGNVVVSGAVSVAGAMTVKGTITASDVLLPNADCAEDFDVTALAEPGDVMVLDPDGAPGALRPCAAAYDHKVAGVISGAGAYRPALVLDHRGASEGRKPIALVGKVCCKVDASYGAVAVGDLLVTSPTLGHAMKASDRERCVGAILGKALAPLAEGRGLVAVLVALQ